MGVEYSVAMGNDLRLVIDGVGGDWDKAAEEGGATGLKEEDVVGRMLFEFITGDAARMWVEALVVRAIFDQKPVKRSYRCDTPTTRRIFELEVENLGDKRALLRHTNVHSEEKDTRVTIISSSGAGDIVNRCSICNFVRLDGQWRDPFNLGRDRTFTVIHTVCPSCKSSIQQKRSARASTTH